MNLPSAFLSARPLGKTALQVTPFGLGTGPFGSAPHWQPGEPIPQNQAVSAVHSAFEHGIRLFDTAPFYGAGTAERYLGAALAELPRDQVLIATKVGRLIEADGNVVFDYSRDGVRRSLEDSLKRLKVDRVDILHIHDADDHYHQALEEAFPALADLRSQGVIKAVSAGMNQWQMLSDFAHHADFDCFLLAGRYTLLEQGALNFLAMCQSKGIGILLAGIYNSGILAIGAKEGATYNYRPPPPDVMERVSRIEAVCARFNVPLRVAALHFATAHPAVTCAVMGIASVTEVEDLLRVQQTPVAPALWQALKAEGLIDEAAPTPIS